MVDVAIAVALLETLHKDGVQYILDVAKLADRKGIDQIIVAEHVVMTDSVEQYPYGPFPVPVDCDLFEPVVLLAAIASITERLRLSTGILIAPLRSAVLLAKQLATLDLISRGRVEIGVGTGWLKDEYDVSGVPWDGRYTRLEEQILACRQLWTNAPAQFKGKTLDFEGLYCKPFPSRPGGPPIWFGFSASDRNIERMARCGDGWIPDPLYEEDPDQLAHAIDKIKAALVAHDRDPSTFQVRMSMRPVINAQGSPDVDLTLRRAKTFVDAGATIIHFYPILFISEPDQMEGFLDQILTLKD